MLKLRALEPEDLDVLYEIENNEQEWGIGSTTVPYSRYALSDYIANNAYDIYTDKQLRQVITNEDNKVIGLVDLINFEPRHSRAEVAIIIAHKYRHQHYALHSLEKLIAYAKDFLHLHQLYALVPETNFASVNLFKKLGFEESATLKEWIFNSCKAENALLFQLFLKKH